MRVGGEASVMWSNEKLITKSNDVTRCGKKEERERERERGRERE